MCFPRKGNLCVASQDAYGDMRLVFLSIESRFIMVVYSISYRLFAPHASDLYAIMGSCLRQFVHYLRQNAESLRHFAPLCVI